MNKKEENTKAQPVWQTYQNELIAMGLRNGGFANGRTANPRQWWIKEVGKVCVLVVIYLVFVLGFCR